MRKTITFWVLLLLTFGVQAQDNDLLTRIPFELKGEHIFIRLNIEGSEELEFVFDTGAGATVINSSIAQKLNMTSGKTLENTGASGKVSTELIEDKQIVINSLELSKIDLQSAQLEHLEQSFGIDIDGIIGYDFLKEYVVEINYNSSELIVFDSNGYHYRGNGTKVKIDLGSVPTAVFEVKLDDGTYSKEEFILDSGAGLALAFATPFSKKNNLKKAMGKTYPNNARGFSKNIAEVDIGRIKGFKVLGNEFKNVPASVYNTNAGVFSLEGIAGIVGNEILKQFNITFDYKRKRSYWEPNQKFTNDPFKVSHSGIKLKLDSEKSKVIVDYIVPESEVANSELRIGDEIIEIDGIKSSGSTLSQLNDLLRQSGKRIEIKYLQNNELKVLSIDLKPLI